MNEIGEIKSETTVFENTFFKFDEFYIWKLWKPAYEDKSQIILK